MPPTSPANLLPACTDLGTQFVVQFGLRVSKFNVFGPRFIITMFRCDVYSLFINLVLTSIFSREVGSLQVLKLLKSVCIACYRAIQVLRIARGGLQLNNNLKPRGYFQVVIIIFNWKYIALN